MLWLLIYIHNPWLINNKLQFAKFLKFDNFNSKAWLGCLNECMALIAIDIWSVFEGNALENYTVVILSIMNLL